MNFRIVLFSLIIFTLICFMLYIFDKGCNNNNNNKSNEKFKNSEFVIRDFNKSKELKKFMNKIKEIQDPSMIYLKDTGIESSNICDIKSTHLKDKENTKKRDLKLECMNKPYQNKNDDELNKSLLPNGNLWIA